MIILIRFEINLNIHVEATGQLWPKFIRFVEITKVFKQSIIHYVNKLEYSVGLSVRFMICLRSSLELYINFLLNVRLAVNILYRFIHFQIGISLLIMIVMKFQNVPNTHDMKDRKNLLW